MMKVELISFLKDFKSKNFFGIKKGFLIAVSGGVDSMVLLHLMQLSDYQIAVAHIDHKTRNGQSTKDAIFLESYCLKNGIIFHKSDYIDGNISHGNFHHQAHKFRYEFFTSLEYDYILTAHHQDDNIETIFLNFVNGKSITGIPQTNNNIIRPLLHYSKEAIMQYAQANNVPYVEDQSNQTNEYDRNYIRNNILPVLKSRFSHIQQKILNLSIRNSLDDNLLSTLVADQIQIKGTEKTISIPKSLIRDRPTLLYHCIKSYGYNRQQAHNIISAIDSIGRLFYADNNTLIIDRDDLIITKNIESDTEEVHIIIDTIPLSIKYLGYTFNFEKVLSVTETGSNILYIPIRLLDEIITLRTWREADRFQPTGMNGHSKSLKKFFIDSKINRLEKHTIPIMLSGDNIVWICGHRSDNRYRYSDSDTDLLKVSLLP